ncbi:MAG TPA: hypothetical protein VLE48_09940 [Terriglobales bacterium]|nr:hypothetical protein [Terriglobales bacterium]
MKSPEKVLLGGGMLLLVAGLLFGAAYGYLVEHQPLLVLRESYRDLLASSAAGDVAGAQAALTQAQRMNYAYVRAVDVHTHTLKLANVILLVGLFYPMVALSEVMRRRLAILFVAASWLFPAGVFAEIFSPGILPQALAAAGAALAVASLAGIVLGLWRGLRQGRAAS